ncbi:MAG: MazG family protein [Clostridiales bacterium]|nr:MazG family protein [Clostridiales bacterium]
MTVRELKEKLLGEERHDLCSLEELVEILRSEEGCPWDREQDHKSIRSELIEETYEVVEAIDTDNADLLKEELGDVLFEVFFHVQIEKEKGTFTLDDVVGGVVDKMIYRHPHVFGEIKVSGTGEVLDNWEALKTKEKSRLTLREQLEAVPKQYPALLRAQKIAKKAAKGGFDFGEEAAQTGRIEELAHEIAAADGEEREALLTELIWRVVILAGPDADLEKDLGDCLNGFVGRF